MKITLIFIVVMTSIAYCQTPIVGPGSSYSGLFSTPGSVTYDVPGGGLLSITLSNGSTTSATGLWDLTAQGGANISLLGLGVLESGAQTQLTGSALEFNVSNDPDSLIGALGVGTSLHYGWEATAFFATPGFELSYSDLTHYHVSFDVDGTNGLLSSIAGLTPSFTFELVDGFGNPLNSGSHGTLIDIAGLLGSGVPSGTVNLDYTLNGSVPAGPIGIRFRGDVDIGTTALNIGTDFASISNLSISASPVPEPSPALLVGGLGLAMLLSRRRRALA